jgi:phage gp46-like protein
MIALGWDTARAEGVLLREASGGLADDPTLASSVILSLFLDRRAGADDALPAGADRRGWIGDALSPTPGDRIGSRLWLLAREKQTEETRLRAEEYAAEALAWLVEDGLASSVEVAATWLRPGVLALTVSAEPAARFTFEVRL